MDEQADSTDVESLKIKIDLLTHKSADFEKNLLMYKQLKDESDSLQRWMKEVQCFLVAEDVAWGDADTLEAQLEQSNVNWIRFRLA